eukprot:scaffold42794_cov63-Phaeocystis_antarctica.AAC.1
MAAATVAEAVDAEAAEAKAAEAGQRRVCRPGDGMGGCCRGVDGRGTVSTKAKDITPLRGEY